MWVQGEAKDEELLSSLESSLTALRVLEKEEQERLSSKVVDLRARTADAVDNDDAATAFGPWVAALEPECVVAADRNSVFQFVMRAAGAEVKDKKGKKGKKASGPTWRAHGGRMLIVVRALVQKRDLFSKANIAELQVRYGDLLQLGRIYRVRFVRECN